ncbi:unnamed protein product, partial [Rotaria magnacalcarata]
GQRKQIEVKLDDNNNKRSLQYIYYDGEDVGGSVQIKLKKRKNIKAFDWNSLDKLKCSMIEVRFMNLLIYQS